MGRRHCSRRRWSGHGVCWSQDAQKLHPRFFSCGVSNWVWAGQRSRYSDWLRAGRSGNRIPLGARFSAPVQTGPAVYPASCTIGTGFFPGVKSCRGVTLTPHPLLVPFVMKEQSYTSTPLWAVRPIQSLSACTRVNFTFSFPFSLRRKVTNLYFTPTLSYPLFFPVLLHTRVLLNVSCVKFIVKHLISPFIRIYFVFRFDINF